MRSPPGVKRAIPLNRVLVNVLVIEEIEKK